MRPRPRGCRRPRRRSSRRSAGPCGRVRRSCAGSWRRAAVVSTEDDVRPDLRLEATPVRRRSAAITLPRGPAPTTAHSCGALDRERRGRHPMTVEAIEDDVVRGRSPRPAFSSSVSRFEPQMEPAGDDAVAGEAGEVDVHAPCRERPVPPPPERHARPDPPVMKHPAHEGRRGCGALRRWRSGAVAVVTARTGGAGPTPPRAPRRRAMRARAAVPGRR